MFVYLRSAPGLEGGSISSCNLNVIFCPLAHGGLYASFGAIIQSITILIPKVIFKNVLILTIFIKIIVTL